MKTAAGGVLLLLICLGAMFPQGETKEKALELRTCIGENCEYEPPKMSLNAKYTPQTAKPEILADILPPEYTQR